MTPRTLLSAALLLSSGCLIVDGNPGPIDRCAQNPAACQPPPVVNPGTGAAQPACGTPYSLIKVGEGTHDPGRAGYIITANSGTYRITWTGFKEFRGSVFSAPGAMTKFTAGCADGSCALASSEDQVILGNGDPNRIDFVSFPASGKRSGFDFEVRGGVVWLDLLVDGQRQPSRVLFQSADTNALASAPAVPFGLGAILPGSGRGRPTGVTTYQIQASNMPPKMPDNSFGVAWNGVTGWVVDWQPALDGCPHEFRGSVFATAAIGNLRPGTGLRQGYDVVAFDNANGKVDFASLGNMSMTLPSFSFETGSTVLYFDFVFDGVEARRKVIFASGGQISTNDATPFGLGTL